MENKIYILGCCISRDIFNFLDQEVYSISHYIGADVINTATFDRTIEGLEAYVNLYGGNFIQRMFKYMTNGNSLEEALEGADFFAF